MDTAFFKTVKQSQTIITELMIPSYANFGGKIHGGTLLSLMDKVAYVRFASVYLEFEDVSEFMTELKHLVQRLKRLLTKKHW